MRLETLADLDGIVPKVEGALREMAQEGKAGNTLRHRTKAPTSLGRWCVEREYLTESPLRELRPISGSARAQRRALTPAEITRLLAVAPDYLRLLYATALLSGLYLSELRALRRRNLDEINNGLDLDASRTKDRWPGFQPLPAKLVEELAAFADSGLVPSLYQQLGVRFAWPKDALLVVPSHAARYLDRDLKRAGVAKTTKEGRWDFHALRGCVATLAVESGANVREARVLARHSGPELTMDKYIRQRDERLRELAERMGETVLSGLERAADVHSGPMVPNQLERKCLPDSALSQDQTEKGLCRWDTGPD